MSLNLPIHLAEKANSFGESSYGACSAILVLNDSRRIWDVTLAWNSEIVKIGNRSVSCEGDLDFKLADIVDVISQ